MGMPRTGRSQQLPAVAFPAWNSPPKSLVGLTLPPPAPTVLPRLVPRHRPGPSGSTPLRLGEKGRTDRGKAPTADPGRAEREGGGGDLLQRRLHRALGFG